MTTLRLPAALLALAILAPSCGGGGGGGGGAGGFPNNPVGPLNMNGGDVSIAGGANGQGGGGTVSTAVYSEGDIRIGVDPAPAAPFLAPPPGAGTIVTSADLTGTSFTDPGTILIPGVETTPAVAGYTITSTGGDIVLSGSLQSGDGAGTPATLTLNAPAGTVYITGTLSSVNTDGVANGNPGAAIAVNALRVIVTGTIRSSGESGAGGGGGTITLTSTGTHVYLVNATIELRGGDHAAGMGGAGGWLAIGSADEAAVIGGSVNGNGGAGTSNGGTGSFVTVDAPTRVDLNSAFSLRGGNAAGAGNVFGGSGGAIWVNVDQGSTGPAFVFGTIDLGGGSGSGAGAGNTVNGGIGGDLQVGNSNFDITPGAPSVVSMVAGLTAIGGVGRGPGAFGGVGGVLVFHNDFVSPGDILVDGSINASGGSGEFGNDAEGPAPGFPAIHLKTMTGDIAIDSTIVLRGADGIEAGGNGGFLKVEIGSNGTATSGNFSLTGFIICTGGNSTSATGGSGFGGDLRVELRDSSAGASALAMADFQTGSLVDLSGGFAGSTGLAGFGGDVVVIAKGDVTLAGAIYVSGGPSALDLGGDGGAIDVLTDLGGGTAADITIAVTGLLDASGGFGDFFGGSARNNGVPGTVSPAQVAVRLDAGAGGIVTNNGAIYAVGAAFDGDGGDVLFNGAGTPAAGLQYRSGNGFGSPGDFSGT